MSLECGRQMSPQRPGSREGGGSGAGGGRRASRTACSLKGHRPDLEYSKRGEGKVISKLCSLILEK